jgi:hypothetical protein
MLVQVNDQAHYRFDANHAVMAEALSVGQRTGRVLLDQGN